MFEHKGKTIESLSEKGGKAIASVSPDHICKGRFCFGGGLDQRPNGSLPHSPDAHPNIEEKGQTIECEEKEKLQDKNKDQFEADVEKGEKRQKQEITEHSIIVEVVKRKQYESYVKEE